MRRTTLRTLLAALGVLPVAACTRAPGPTGPFDAKLPACYLLRYDQWGDPPRTNGRSMKGVRAPVIVQLLDEPIPVEERFGPSDTSDHQARWILGAEDTLSYPARWGRQGTDSISVTFGTLFGVTGDLATHGADLAGEMRTFSDVSGVTQGRSRVQAIRIPCTMPPPARPADSGSGR